MQHPPCPPYTKPEAYAVECILDDIIAEEKRLDRIHAQDPFWQLGYLKSLTASLLVDNPAAKRHLEQRLESLKSKPVEQ